MNVCRARVEVEIDGSNESVSDEDTLSSDDLQDADSDTSFTKKRQLQSNEKQANKKKKCSITYSISGEKDQVSSDSDSCNVNKAEDKGKNKNSDINLSIANHGWADAMAKVLQLTNKKQLILTKAKKDKDIKIADVKKDKSPLEIVNEKGEAVKEKDEKAKDKESKDAKEIKKKLLLQKKQKKLMWHNMARMKPHINEKEKERMLNRAATRGVVQLFNAVRQHQKTLGEKLKIAGNSEVKKEKVLQSFNKGEFLDILKGGKSKVNRNDADKKWDVLRDDFMMGATMKDWDKDSDVDS